MFVYILALSLEYLSINFHKNSQKDHHTIIMTVNFLFKMTNYLRQRFNKFLDIGARSDYSHVKKQRIKNTNLAALLSFSVGILSTLFTFQIISTPYVFIPLGACCLYLTSLVLNSFEKHELASLNIDLITNLLFFGLANAYGKESSAYLLFILAEMTNIFNLAIIF